MHRFTKTLVAVGAALAIAGCGSGGGESVTVEATEFSYDPADLSIPADTDVELTLDNTGVIEHDITVDELDLHIHANGSSTTTETVNAPAGTYTFYCSVPGHREEGMEGTLTVGS